MSDPKVFGDGDITLALSKSGMMRLYVGQNQVGPVQSLKIEADASRSFPIVEVRFPSKSDVTPELDMKIDEYVRALSAQPWIRVLR